MRRVSRSTGLPATSAGPGRYRAPFCASYGLSLLKPNPFSRNGEERTPSPRVLFKRDDFGRPRGTPIISPPPEEVLYDEKAHDQYGAEWPDVLGRLGAGPVVAAVRDRPDQTAEHVAARSREQLEHARSGNCAELRGVAKAGSVVGVQVQGHRCVGCR